MQEVGRPPAGGSGGSPAPRGPRTRRACPDLCRPRRRAERILPSPWVKQRAHSEDANSDSSVLIQLLLPWGGSQGGTLARREPGGEGIFPTHEAGRLTVRTSRNSDGCGWTLCSSEAGLSSVLATGWGHGLEEEGLQEREAGSAPGRCPAALSPRHTPTRHPPWASKSMGDEAQSSGGPGNARLPSRSEQNACLKAPGMDSNLQSDASRLDPLPGLPSWIIKRFQSLHIIGRPQRAEV